MIEGFISRLIIFAMMAKGRCDVSQMLRHATHAKKTNEELLLRILRENQNCEYGKKFDFAAIRSVEDFKQKVPIITYRDIEADVERIYYGNEQNVLTSQPVIGFATSSGSIGKPKLIPRTEQDVCIYTKYTVTRFLALARQFHRQHGEKMRADRGLCMLYQHREKSPHGLPSTNVADIAAKKYYAIYPYLLVLPLGQQFSSGEIDITYANTRFGLENRNCMFLFSVFAKNIAEVIEYLRDNWQMVVEDIRTGAISPAVEVDPAIRERLEKKLRPNPARADELQREFEKGFDETILHRIWPNMSVISAIGTSVSFEGFTKTIRKYTAGIPLDFSIYGASEGLFAAACRCNERGQLMLPDSCYYEFVPAEQEDAPIEKTLSLTELEVGKDYEIIITNQSGFYRYRFNDIIHVMDRVGECPVVNFLYRRGQLLNINGEKTTLEMMNEALSRLEEKLGQPIRHWAAFVDRGEKQYRYAVSVEFDAERSLAPYEAEFEEMLRRINTSYRYYEGKGLIDPPVLLCQRCGTHDAWRAYKVHLGATVEQVKPVQVLDTEEKRAFFLSEERLYRCDNVSSAV